MDTPLNSWNRRYLNTVLSAQRRSRTPFTPNGQQHAIDETNRRLDKDYPPFLEDLRSGYVDKVVPVYQHFLGQRTEHDNKSLSDSHQALSGICNDLKGQCYDLLDQHPDYKNLYNIANFFGDLATWHHGRHQDHQSKIPAASMPTPTQEVQHPHLPGFEPQRPPNVC